MTAPTLDPDASPASRLHVRPLRLDFGPDDIAWDGVDVPFAHLTSATSFLLPRLERFLVDTATEAAAAHALSPRLQSEVDGFCRQERAHRAGHLRFNAALAAAGEHDRLAVVDARLGDHYERMARRSLAYRLAWADGFETIASLVAVHMFERADEYGLSDWQHPVTRLWLWHMAEEFDHRSVCHDLRRVHDPGHALRMAGLTAATVHLLRHTVPLAWHLAGRAGSARGRRARRRGVARRSATLVAAIGPWLVARAIRRGDPAETEAPDRLTAFVVALDGRA